VFLKEHSVITLSGIHLCDDQQAEDNKQESREETGAAGHRAPAACLHRGRHRIGDGVGDTDGVALESSAPAESMPPHRSRGGGLVQSEGGGLSNADQPRTEKGDGGRKEASGGRVIYSSSATWDDKCLSDVSWHFDIYLAAPHNDRKGLAASGTRPPGTPRTAIPLFILDRSVGAAWT
jgi:hypothetical protein